MKKFIVTTTINPPTEALIKFSVLPNWSLIVVGDKKTPHDTFKELNCIYLHPDKQDELYPDLSKALGWNCVQRRNIGIFHAYTLGADLIATVDDDNIPYASWGEDIHINTTTHVKSYSVEGLAFNLLGALGLTMWHRGYPIEYVTEPREFSISDSIVIPDVQANLWDGAPDVDAICRLTQNTEGVLPKIEQPIHTSNFAPFNSQNSILSRKVIPHYFLFPFIGRMDDIWASYYVEALGFNVIFDKATVYQKRNGHDIIKDLELEILGYRSTLKLLYSLKNGPDNIIKYLPSESAQAFSIWRGMF